MTDLLDMHHIFKEIICNCGVEKNDKFLKFRSLWNLRNFGGI